MAKSALFAILALCLMAIAQAHYAVTDALIHEVNSKQSSWKAAHNRFSKMHIEEVKGLLGTKMMKVAEHKKLIGMPHIKANEAIPSSFDARQQWPECHTIQSIRDQAQCGSCWAFGASESLSDRMCIATNGTFNVFLAPQSLVSCDYTNEGCNGGMLPAAWEYMQSTGIALDTCLPYTSGGGVSGSCPTKCADGSSVKLYKAKSHYSVSSIFPWKRVEIMQTELQTNGPFEVAFTVYNDFMSYTSGVYVHTTGSELGGHAVKVVGWGVDATTGMDYWLIANSWTTSWGEQGFFRIRRGTNECGIESQGYAGLADASSL